jgi:imidazolonepropionase-like amidohydrolase
MKAHAWIAAIVAGLGATVVAQNPPPRPPPQTTVVRDVTLIDGTGAAPREHVSLTIRDGNIAGIADAAVSPSAPADLVVDGRGRFAVPGLFDAHVHLSPSRWDQRIDQLRRVLHGGVTSLYDVAGDVRQTSDFARAALAHEIESPSIDYCTLMAGPAFFTDPRVVGSSLGFRAGEAPWNRAITPATTDADLVRAVAAAKGTGASAIKLYAALDAATVRRIADEAHRQGMRLVAHATVFPAKPSDLVAAGVNMLAHSAYLVWEGSAPSPDFPNRALGDFEHVKPDSPEIERLLVSMRDSRVALNPTLWVFTEGPPSRDAMGPARIAWMNAVTHRAAELGVAIVAGTDGLIAGNGPPALHKELELLVSGAHLTPMQALLSATRDAARAIGVDQVRGTIETGKAADVVLLAANPLDDIRNTTTISTVVKSGRVVFGGEPKSAPPAPVAPSGGTRIVLPGTGTPLPNPGSRTSNCTSIGSNGNAHRPGQVLTLAIGACVNW